MNNYTMDPYILNRMFQTTIFKIKEISTLCRFWRGVFLRHKNNEGRKMVEINKS